MGILASATQLGLRYLAARSNRALIFSWATWLSSLDHGMLYWATSLWMLTIQLDYSALMLRYLHVPWILGYSTRILGLDTGLECSLGLPGRLRSLALIEDRLRYIY